MLNVTIVWPNLYLYEGESVPVAIESNSICAFVNYIRLNIHTIIIPPSSTRTILMCAVGASPLIIVTVFRSKAHSIVICHWISSGPLESSNS